MRVQISEAELNTRKSNGAVFICRSCKDNAKKIMMVQYEQTKGIPNGIYYQFCSECLKLMGDCIPCRSKK
jgi:hypothetical protein